MMIRADSLREIAEHVTTIELVENELCKRCLKRAQEGNFEEYFSVPIQYADTITDHFNKGGYVVTSKECNTGTVLLHIEW